MCQFSPGHVLSFAYPTENRVGVRCRLVRRRFAVCSVRDCESEPIDELTRWLDPWRRRGRWLLTGYDLELRRERSFYLESARSLRVVDAPAFRLGHYDPLDLAAPVQLVGPVFLDTAEDLVIARAALRQASERSEDHLRAFGLFAVIPRKSRKSVPAFEPALR